MVVAPVKADSIDGVWGYLTSIDWEEPWLWGVLGFHVLCAALVGLTTLMKKQSIQAGLFIIYLGIIYYAEWINEWAAMNWKSFASQQYFDSQGLFISIIVSGPLLINCLVIVCVWMYDTACLMFNLQKAKVQAKKAAQDRVAEKEKKSN